MEITLSQSLSTIWMSAIGAEKIFNDLGLFLWGFLLAWLEIKDPKGLTNLFDRVNIMYSIDLVCRAPK